MRVTYTVFLVLFFARTAWCDTTGAWDSAAVLARVWNVNETSYGELKSFVCDENILRYRSALDGSRPRAIDSVTASLSFENGTEHYSSIQRNTQMLPGISNLSGAWSEGEFGTLLRQTIQLSRVEPVSFERLDTWDGASALLYTFNVPASDSPWELVVDGHGYRLSFQTQFWVDAASAQIVRVVRTASSVERAAAIAEIQWSLNLRPVRLLGKEWLLPATAQYSVSYAHSDRREWNEIAFSHYHRYGSEVALRFDQP